MSGAQADFEVVAAKYEAEFAAIDEQLEANDWEALKYVDRLNQSVYARRNEIIRKIPGFWLAAFQQNAITSSLIEPNDEPLLQQLEEISVKRPDEDPRGYDFVFTFRPENGYLKSNVIQKSFRPREQKSNGKLTGKAEDPVVIYSEPSKLEWVSEEKNLVKRSPHKLPEKILNGAGGLSDDALEEELDQFMLGSFFNAFLISTDLLDIFTTIGSTIFPNAWDYFTGSVNLDQEDEEDDLESDSLEEDEDGDEDEDETHEIDLEHPAGPQVKRLRMA